MHSHHNADGQPLIHALEDVNHNVRLVQFAWTRFSQWQEIGGRCELTRQRLSIARSLLIEAIEDWAYAVGRLLKLARPHDGLEQLSESLEQSLRRAAAYLGRVLARSDPMAPIYVRFAA